MERIRFLKIGLWGALGFALFYPVTAGAQPSMLIYGPTSGCYENSAPGFNITVWSAAVWATKTTADFAAFNLIVFADCPYCITNPAVWNTAIATASVWGPAITGNQVIVGSDLDDHIAANGVPVSLLYNFLNFAGSGTGTGLYAALSCVYENSVPNTPVPLLSGLGTFTVEAAGIGGSCADAAHKIALHPALNGVTDALLSNWHCSVHEGFDSWPAGYLPLAIATDAANPNYVAPDQTTGLVYILAKGSQVVPVPTPCGFPANTCTPTMTPTPTDTPTPTPTNTPCGFPGNTCTPTMTPTPTPLPNFIDIYSADKNILNTGLGEKVTITVQYNRYPGPYSLKVYNTAGEYIQKLANNPNQNVPINDTVTWDGLNWKNEPCASGVYILFLVEPFDRKVKRLILIR